VAARAREGAAGAGDGAASPKASSPGLGTCWVAAQSQAARPMKLYMSAGEQRRRRLRPRFLASSASPAPAPAASGGRGRGDRPQGPRAVALARPSGGSASAFNLLSTRRRATGIYLGYSLTYPHDTCSLNPPVLPIACPVGPGHDLTASAPPVSPLTWTLAGTRRSAPLPGPAALSLARTTISAVPSASTAAPRDLGRPRVLHPPRVRLPGAAYHTPRAG